MTNPKMEQRLEEILSCIRTANNHAAYRYLEGLAKQSYEDGFNFGWKGGEERDSKGLEWEDYTGEPTVGPIND